jgi:hypothetical protein
MEVAAHCPLQRETAVDTEPLPPLKRGNDEPQRNSGLVVGIISSSERQY